MGFVPLGLAALGAVVPLIGGGFGSLGLAVAWLVGMVLVASLRVALRVEPRMRVLLDIIGLALVLVVLFPLGGWWFAPAVAAQLVIDRRDALRLARPTYEAPLR